MIIMTDECKQPLNKLAREQTKLRLLQDIQFDLMVCEIEGWCQLEYLSDLRLLLDELINKNK